MKSITLLIVLFVSITLTFAQKIGINTDNPHSVLHVNSSGQVHHPDGLLLLGSRSEAHMMGDFNYLQSFWSDQGGVINMYLQPHGGNVGINVPFNSASFAPLHVYGEGINNTTYGLGVFGNRTLKHLVVDFDRIQARNNNDPDKLFLQATGGDIDMGGGTLYVDESAERVGVSTVTPQAQFDILSNGNTSASKALQVRNSNYANMLIVRDDGHVGIGTSAPNYDLQVVGNIGLSSKVIHANDDDTYLRLWSDKITFNAGGKELLDLTESFSGQDVITLGDGSDVDINMNGSALHVNGASGWVGIGTTTPDAKFEVNGDMKISSKLIHTLDDDTYLQFLTDRIQLKVGNRLMLDVSEGAEDYVSIADGVMYVNRTTGNVGINVFNADSDFHIIQGSTQGGITLENSDQNTWLISHGSTENLGLWFNGYWRGSFDDADGDYNSASDRRLKKHIADLGPVLDKVNQLAPKTYLFKTQDDSAPKNIGFIAQELLEVFPEVVSYNEDQDLYGVDYNDFSVISIQAIRELTELVHAQQEEIEALKGEMRVLKADMAER